MCSKKQRNSIVLSNDNIKRYTADYYYCYYQHIRRCYDYYLFKLLFLDKQQNALKFRLINNIYTYNYPGSVLGQTGLIGIITKYVVCFMHLHARGVPKQRTILILLHD